MLVTFCNYLMIKCNQNGIVLLLRFESRTFYNIGITGAPIRRKDTTMNAIERLKMIKAMEFLARHINDQAVVDEWLSGGIADGDIVYGSLAITKYDLDSLDHYTEDENFADLMDTFLCVMSRALRSGGLYFDGVVSRRRRTKPMITFNNITKCFSIDTRTALLIRIALRETARLYKEQGMPYLAGDAVDLADRMQDLEEQGDD